MNVEIERMNLLSEVTRLKELNRKLENKLTLLTDDLTLRLMIQLAFVNFIWIMYGFFISDMKLATYGIVSLAFNSFVIMLFINFTIYKHI